MNEKEIQEMILDIEDEITKIQKMKGGKRKENYLKVLNQEKFKLNNLLKNIVIQEKKGGTYVWNTNTFEYKWEMFGL